MNYRPPMELGLAGRRALVSGGSQGIGRAVVETLLREGCAVEFCARGAEGVQLAAKELGELGTVRGDVCDVSDAAAVRDWVGAAGERLGGIDVVVSNASASGQHGDGEQPWRTNFEIDVLGAVAMIEAAKPYLERSDAAAIVQVATITAIEHHDVPINPSYGALKAATINYMAQLAQRWGPLGIRANTVSPGPILIEGGKWDGLQHRRPEIFERDRDRHPTKRMGTAQEVANMVAVLASPAASWVNGAHLVVDGGYTKRVGF